MDTMKLNPKQAMKKADEINKLGNARSVKFMQLICDVILILHKDGDSLEDL